MVRADFFFVFLLLFVPSCLWAVDATNKKNEKRHIVYGGYSAHQGKDFQNRDAYPVRLGYSYIAKNIFVVGCFYEPFLMFDSRSVPEDDGRVLTRSSALGPYIGFKQPEGNFIVTAGPTYAMTKFSLKSSTAQEVRASGSGVGLSLGASCICDKMMIGARLSTYRFRLDGVGDNQGRTFGVDVGYVF